MSRLRRLTQGPEATQADTLVEQAREAVASGRKAEARRALWAALALDRESVRAWLMLAALASPQASLDYAQRALALHPASPVALAAVDWARARAQTQVPKPAAPVPPPPVLPEAQLNKAPAVEALAPRSTPSAPRPPALAPRSTPPAPRPTPLAPRPPAPAPRPTSRRWALGALALLALIVLIGLGAVFATRSGAALPHTIALAGEARPAVAALAAVDDFQKATAAPLPTDTPTVTPSPTATPPFTPTPSITPTPSESPTPLPFEAGAGQGEARWIDVNLSLQMLTAMEGEAPVNTFIVSTGLWNTPTVTGQYRVYVKYVAADMSGPGYYLPQVPYVMYFYKDYGIHGTYWHNNFGHPMSHGCVNMQTDQAGWLFDWASVGTLVNVHY